MCGIVLIARKRSVGENSGGRDYKCVTHAPNATTKKRKKNCLVQMRMRHIILGTLLEIAATRGVVPAEVLSSSASETLDAPLSSLRS